MMDPTAMDQQTFNGGLLAFLQASPTPFHAVANLGSALAAAGFIYLAEDEPWHLQIGGRYYTTRNGSSIIAFAKGKRAESERGLRLVGTHTDSPRLVVKPNPERVKDYFQLGVEVYGGALLNPWFDRDLSLAGRVVFRHRPSGELRQALIDYQRPLAVIPSLAIHLDREANQNHAVNPQTDILPLLFTMKAGRQTQFSGLLAERIAFDLGDSIALADIHVIDYELSFYDTQPPALIGLYDDFIASARLDNLLSCYAGVQALLAADAEVTSLLICTDHEEVGSNSACGAAGPMLDSVLRRIIADGEERTRALSRSLLISADNAHGVHPNFAGKHDPNHGPLLNGGPVIKINNNQRYATNSLSAALFRGWCEAEGVPVQTFVTRSDLGCGSTIGPITATAIGVPTLDVGVPTFAMHSIRELAGANDSHALFSVLRAFYHHAGALAVF
ncbi:MAG: M18 family aminopeptidase [Porticoccaceae bacterium]